MTFPKSLLVAILASTLLVPPAGAEGDREYLGKAINTLPPNGPFWQYGNVVMRKKSQEAGLPPVVFSHWVHRPYFTCRVCHQELGFSMRLGDTGIARSDYLAGKYCGACHDGKTAFNVRDGDPSACGKCHLKDPASLEQKFESFAKNLPMAKFGNGIDWAAALDKERISPINSLQPSKQQMDFPKNLRRPIRMATVTSSSDVTFSHADHFAELDCSSCHPDIFSIKRKGTERFSMEANLFGTFCGACHLKVAFPMNDCRRCHPRMSAY